MGRPVKRPPGRPAKSPEAPQASRGGEGGRKRKAGAGLAMEALLASHEDLRSALGDEAELEAEVWLAWLFSFESKEWCR